MSDVEESYPGESSEPMVQRDAHEIEEPLQLFFVSRVGAVAHIPSGDGSRTQCGLPIGESPLRATQLPVCLNCSRWIK